MISGAGLIEVVLAGKVDTFGGARGEAKARQFGTSGYAIGAMKPTASTTSSRSRTASPEGLVAGEVGR